MVSFPSTLGWNLNLKTKDYEIIQAAGKIAPYADKDDTLECWLDRQVRYSSTCALHVCIVRMDWREPLYKRAFVSFLTAAKFFQVQTAIHQMLRPLVAF